MKINQVVLLSLSIIGAKTLIDKKEQGAVFRHNDSNDFLRKIRQVLSLSVNHEVSLISDSLSKAVDNFL